VGRWRRAITEAAQRVADGVAGPETYSLAAKLENAAGVSIAELATAVEQWPEV
jgi:hypothetical protein